MTLFPNRFQFTSPGEENREREREQHLMPCSMWNVCCLPSNWNRKISRSFTFLSFELFSFFAGCVVDAQRRFNFTFILSLTIPSNNIFFSRQFWIPIFLLSFWCVASAILTLETIHLLIVLLHPISDMVFGKVHKHISSCTFSTIKWKVHYDVSSRTFLRGFFSVILQVHRINEIDFAHRVQKLCSSFFIDLLFDFSSAHFVAVMIPFFIRERGAYSFVQEGAWFHMYQTGK